jgi:tetratricopeptide (TPR) repeat protein
MLGKYIRLILAILITVISVFLFVNSFAGWGMLAAVIALLFVLFQFKNEMNLLAFFFIRRNKFSKAESILSKVKRPEKMMRSQEAYYYYLLGLVQAQTHQPSKAEKSFKKALSTGLRLNSDQAMAKLNLAGFYLSKRNKKLAKIHLMDAKKLDKQKMLTAQIKEVENMMKRI